MHHLSQVVGDGDVEGEVTTACEECRQPDDSQLQHAVTMATGLVWLHCYRVPGYGAVRRPVRQQTRGVRRPVRQQTRGFRHPVRQTRGIRRLVRRWRAAAAGQTQTEAERGKGVLHLQSHHTLINTAPVHRHHVTPCSTLHTLLNTAPVHRYHVTPYSTLHPSRGSNSHSHVKGRCTSSLRLS